MQSGDDTLESESVLHEAQDEKKKMTCEEQIEIKNTDGLHMRPAMQFVDIASKFECDINVSNGETSVDGKSIMQISMLAATCGTKLRIRAEGSDAQDAINALKELVEDKHFDEPLPKSKKKKQ